MAAKTVTIEEAGRNLSKLVDAIGENDELILAKGDKPVAKIVSLKTDKKPADVEKPRTVGDFRGRIWVSEDFDEPLPDDFWLGGEP